MLYKGFVYFLMLSFKLHEKTPSTLNSIKKKFFALVYVPHGNAQLPMPFLTYAFEKARQKREDSAPIDYNRVQCYDGDHQILAPTFCELNFAYTGVFFSLLPTKNMDVFASINVYEQNSKTGGNYGVK